MLSCYCPHSACATRVPYDTIKPTVCPKCHKTFASAFAPTPAPAPVVTRAAVVDDPDDRPLTKSALLAARKTGGARLRPTPRAEVTHLMNAPAAAQPVFPDDGADEEDEQVDPREVRRQARALAATIDTSAIIADAGALDGGDKPVKGIGSFSFRDMWAEGASVREKATASQTKPAKRKARR